MTGYDSAFEVAWRIVERMRAEFEYESDRKAAVSNVAAALQEAYKCGMDELRREQENQNERV